MSNKFSFQSKQKSQFLITGTMDFGFNLNETFPGTSHILKISHDLLPSDYNMSFNGRNFHLLQQRVSDILDAMGEASARAQGLKAPITSGSRLRMQSEHVVYILLDRSSNSVVGLLKVGKKNLFLIGNIDFFSIWC